MEPLLAMFGIVAAIAAVGWAIAYAAKGEARWNEAVAHTAQRFGLGYNPKTFWKRSSATGTTGGLPVTVDAFTVSTGKSSTTYTRIVALPGLPPDVEIKPEGLGASIVKVFKGADFEIGDAHFDGQVVLRGDASRLRPMLDRETRTRVLAALDAGIVVDAGTVKYQRGGLERDPEKLAALTQMVVDLANALQPGGDKERLERIALDDGDDEVALGAFRERLRRWPASTFPQTMLSHRLPALRLEAAGLVGDVRVVAELAEDRRTAGPLRRQAVTTLARLDLERGLSAAQQVLREGPDEVLATATLALLAEHGRCPPPAVVQALLEVESLRAPTARCLAHATEGGEAALVALLDDEDAEVAQAAAEGLAVQGTVAAVPALRARADRMFAGDVGRACKRAIEQIQSGIGGLRGGLAVLREREAGGLALPRGATEEDGER